MPDIPDEIIELDLGVTPEAAVSGAVLLQTEDRTFLTFSAMRPAASAQPSGRRSTERAGTAVAEFKRCLATRFGYPNDEARWGIPHYRDMSYGIFEVRGSTWIEEVNRLNQYSFPDTTDDHATRHFLFTFHDSTFECLADDVAIEISNEPYSAIFERIRRRAFDEDAT